MEKAKEAHRVASKKTEEKKAEAEASTEKAEVVSKVSK